MRICFMTSTYPRNPADGIGSFVRNLAESLVSLGHTVHVVAPYDPQVAPMPSGGVQVHRFRYPPWNDKYLIGHARGMVADERLTRAAPLLLPGFLFSAIAKMLAWHRREHFDLLHAHWLLPGGVMGACGSCLTGLPLMLSLHGSGVYFARQRRLYGVAARVAMQRAYHIVACSPNLREGVLALGVDSARVSVLQYGVDAQHFAEGNGERLRVNLGIPAGALVIGAIGRLARKKGFDRLITAMPQVLRQEPTAYAIIAGDGDLRDALRQEAVRVGAADRVLFAGQISWEQIADFYALCDVLVVPSVAEPGGNVDGLPSVVLEGMASGCALVASDVAGIPTAVKHSHNGLLVPPDDVAALAQAILRLLENDGLRQALGAQARLDMTEQRSWRAYAERISSIYQQAVEATRR